MSHQVMDMQLDQIIFKCRLCGEMFDAHKYKCFVVQIIDGAYARSVVEDGRAEFAPAISGTTLCEACFIDMDFDPIEKTKQTHRESGGRSIH